MWFFCLLSFVMLHGKKEVTAYSSLFEVLKILSWSGFFVDSVWSLHTAAWKYQSAEFNRWTSTVGGKLLRDLFAHSYSIFPCMCPCVRWLGGGQMSRIGRMDHSQCKDQESVQLVSINHYEINLKCKTVTLSPGSCRWTELI